MASGTPSLLPAKTAAAGRIPVVIVAAIDPVATGLIASLARPGGNITGLTAIQTDLVRKRLELLKQVLPNLSKVAVLVRATSQVTAQYVKEAQLATQTIGAEMQVLEVRDAGDLESAFSAARGASALLHADDAVFTAHRSLIAELALKNRLPTVSGIAVYVEAGGFMAYGADVNDLYRRAATHVHRILKGAKPADLPFEQPTTFYLIINMRIAKALGITVPQSIVLRADQIIE